VGVTTPTAVDVDPLKSLKSCEKAALRQLQELQRSCKTAAKELRLKFGRENSCVFKFFKAKEKLR